MKQKYELPLTENWSWNDQKTEFSNYQIHDISSIDFAHSMKIDFDEYHCGMPYIQTFQV